MKGMSKGIPRKGGGKKLGKGLVVGPATSLKSPKR